jgi:hypothetical protein
MTLAVLYCKGEELGVTEITKRATGYSTQQLAGFSERLLQAAKDIQALNESGMPGGIGLLKLIRVFGGASAPTRLPSTATISVGCRLWAAR